MYTIVNKSNIAKRPFELHLHQQTALYKTYKMFKVIDSLNMASATEIKQLRTK